MSSSRLVAVPIGTVQKMIQIDAAGLWPQRITQKTRITRVDLSTLSKARVWLEQMNVSKDSSNGCLTWDRWIDHYKNYINLYEIMILYSPLGPLECIAAQYAVHSCNLFFEHSTGREVNCREPLLYLDEVCGWAHSSVEATGALFMDQYQANYQHFKAMHLDTCLCRDAFAEKLLGPSTAADDPMSLAQCNSQQLVTCPGTESGFKISYRSIRLAQHHFDDLRCQSVQDVSASVCPEAETTGGCTYQRVAWLHVILKSA